MEIIDCAFEELLKAIPPEKHNDKCDIIRIARQTARITCRSMGNALGLTLSQVSDIEHGRLEVPEVVYQSMLSVCVSKMIVQKEMTQLGTTNGKRT